MLKHLQINNYAIIEDLKIIFNDGMNVITGETGAGKSIIIGALNLILGERADTTVLMDKTQKSVIEGVFKNDKNAAKDFLAENDLDDFAEITVRREITPNGKSRAFINDTPVTLQQLQQLKYLLVDLHRQFDTLSINESHFQKAVIDALADTAPLLKKYKEDFAQWQKILRSLQQLKTRQAELEKEKDYLQFQYEELATANFKENELEDAATELKALTSAEDIQSALVKAYTLLEDGEAPIVQQLKVMVNDLQSYEKIYPGLGSVSGRLAATQIELKDIAGEIDKLQNGLNYDEARIAELNDRLSTGYKLQKKHAAGTTAELIHLKNELEARLQTALNADTDIENLEAEAKKLEQELTQNAAAITALRTSQVPPFEQKVNELLAQVGMPNAALKVSIVPATLGADGADDINFLFDANKSGQFKPLNKVASGGELSRLMLCVKSLVAKKMDLPTLIFDEIDTGISGEAAKQVGVIMKALAATRQVVCITHQPQIAGQGDAHFFVYKLMENDKVNTHVKQLTTEERITNIAKMLSGEKPTAAAIANAREMVMH